MGTGTETGTEVSFPDLSYVLLSIHLFTQSKIPYGNSDTHVLVIIYKLNSGSVKSLRFITVVFEAFAVTPKRNELRIKYEGVCFVWDFVLSSLYR